MSFTFILIDFESLKGKKHTGQKNSFPDGPRFWLGDMGSLGSGGTAVTCHLWPDFCCLSLDSRPWAWDMPLNTDKRLWVGCLMSESELGLSPRQCFLKVVVVVGPYHHNVRPQGCLRVRHTWFRARLPSCVTLGKSLPLCGLYFPLGEEKLRIAACSRMWQ